MIYEYPSPTDSIRQGDIFRSLPLIRYSPQRLLLISPEGTPEDTPTIEVNFATISDQKSVSVVVTVEPALGIVITQDCDADRTNDIAFFQIGTFTDITGLMPTTSTNPEKQSNWWIDAITRKSRGEEGAKWFYLPLDPRMGFTERIAIDFQSIFQVDRHFLHENLPTLRVGRLNDIADEHFREKIAQYFRRYPYNEWYPLSPEEFKHYTRDATRRDTPPYTWQE